LADARRFDPAQHTRSILAPYRDAILLFRAKFMSYELIAATLTRHGVSISPAAVGCFCRRHFTKAQIQAARRNPPPGSPALPSSTLPADPTAPSRSASPTKRGPKIARDDF
jgi:hypothetical protein